MADKRINTDGGTFVGKDANIDEGDFVGRDKTNTTNRTTNSMSSFSTQLSGNLIVAIVAVLFLGVISTISILKDRKIDQPVVTSLTPVGIAITSFTHTQNPTFTPVLTASSTSVPVYGPKEGELHHDGKKTVEWQSIKASITNSIIEATFVNPYSATEHLWDMFISFRFAHGKGFRIDFSSKGEWGYGVELPEWKSIYSATLDPTVLNKLAFKTEKGETNHLRLIVYEAKGCFYVNNEFVGELDLSDLNQVGDILVGIGSYHDSEFAGAITEYKNFTVYRIDHFSGCS